MRIQAFTRRQILKIGIVMISVMVPRRMYAQQSFSITTPKRQPDRFYAFWRTTTGEVIRTEMTSEEYRALAQRGARSPKPPPDYPDAKWLQAGQWLTVETPSGVLEDGHAAEQAGEILVKVPGRGHPVSVPLGMVTGALPMITVAPGAIKGVVITDGLMVTTVEPF